MGQTERSGVLEALDRLGSWGNDDYVDSVYGRWSDAAVVRRALSVPASPDEQRWLQAQHDNALALIRMRGVPKTRAKYLPIALDVLLTRLDREITAQRAEIEELSALVDPED